MSIRAIGILLVWLGTLLLVAVLQHRVRQGAWKPEALEEMPPLTRWAVPVTLAGLGLALAGAGLAMWSFL